MDDLVESYNNSYHRSIKTKPALVNKDNEKCIFNNLYGEIVLSQEAKINNPKFSVGNYVRIPEEKNIFSKGYTPNWSDQIYIVSEVLYDFPEKYKIKDLEAKVKVKSFY